MGFSIDLLGLRLGFSGSSNNDFLDRYIFPGLPRHTFEGADVTFSPRDGLVQLQQAVDEYVIAHATRFTFIHAGVIGLNGVAALLVGSSGHGKSTLVAELIRTASYYSDEYAAIDEQGRLHPYPRALLMREGRPEQRPVAAQDLGAQVADGSADVRLILSLPYQVGAQICMDPVGQSQGLRLLLENTPHVLEDSPALFKKLTRVAGGARTFVGVRGEAAEAADAILQLLRAQ